MIRQYYKSDNVLKIVKEDENAYFIRYAYKKIFEDNEDFILIVTGKRGKGKSYASLRTGQTFSNYVNIPFNVQDNVKYTVKALLNTVNSEKYQSGTVIIMEEAGVHANARKFMSEVNSAINFLIQTVRTRHYFFIFNLPMIKMMDFSVRNMASAKIEIIAKIKSEKVSIGKFYLLNYNESMKRDERRFLRLKRRGEMKLSVIKLIKFRLPSPDIIVEYEKKKKEYTAKLYSDLENSISGEMGEIELDNSAGNLSEYSTVDEKLLNNLIYLRNNERLKNDQISAITGISPKIVKKMFRLARERNIKVKTNLIRDDEFNVFGINYYKDKWRKINEVVENGNKT